MNAGDSDTVQADAVHQEYMAEAKGLIDNQVEQLFSKVSAVVARVAQQAPQGQHVVVTRNGYGLNIVNGNRTAVLTVEAITDLPEGADRALAFATSQAQCTLRAPDGTTTRWLLHRVGAGQDIPTYTWMHDRSDTPINEQEMASLLRPLFMA